VLLNPAKKALRMLCIAGLLLSTKTFSQQRLGLDVAYRGYMSNYEYFNDVVPGYTLFGNVLEPTLTFKPDTNWTLHAGAWLQQDFGRDGFRRVEPNFRLAYNRNRFRFNFGNLDIYDQHHLPAWLYDADDFITRGPAYGAQIKTNGYRLRSDAWIAWRSMIYPESAEQEHIEAGVSGKVNLIDSSKSTRFYVLLHGVALHSGGQIGHIDSTQRVTTILASSAGLGIAKRLDGSFLKTIGLEGLLGYSNNDDREKLPGGLALATKAFVAFDHGLSLEAGWWVGNNFYAPFGAPLYQSRSSVYASDTSYFNQRQLLTLTATWHTEPVKNFEVDAWLQPHYDVNMDLFEYAYRLRLTYTFDATLKQFD
jgi:hypothetical protein